MNSKNPLVSLVIAAYNNPEYTRKTLQSIVDQDYRPIDVFLSDDCSPVSLKPLADEFKCFENDLFIIRYFRQEHNLAGADNMTFCFDNAIGKYVVQMPHDDWFTDNSFLSQAVELMEKNPECYLCAANSILEGTGEPVLKIPPQVCVGGEWTVLSGDTYVKIFGMDKIGHQAWSGLVFNTAVARSLGAFHYPFNLSKDEAAKIGLLADEGFAFQYLLSSVGDVALTAKVISVRGRPAQAFCNQNAKVWSSMVGQVLFVLYFNIYKAKLTGRYAKAVRNRAKNAIFHYPAERFNLKIIKHYKYDSEAIFLMILACISRRWLDIKNQFKYLVSVWKFYQDLFKKEGLRAVFKRLLRRPAGFSQ